MSEKSQAAVERYPLHQKLAKQIQSQFKQFEKSDLTSYTVERRRSDFRGAKTDLTVFNQDSKIVLMGRDFGDRTFFWQP